MKQLLGKKKHAICERIGGRTYLSCWTRGGWTHGLAECFFALPDDEVNPVTGSRPANVDFVNYLTGEVDANYYLKGQRPKKPV